MVSRQENRAADRRLRKTLRKISLAAGEGVGKAVAFSFALASNALAAEPKKEETFDLPPVVVEEQGSPYVVPQSSLSKFPEPLKDTPQSITIVPEKLIQEQAGSSLRDALRNVPGMGITAGENGGSQGDGFTLRGFNARNDMFIDGIRDAGSYFRDSFNIDSVEVIKGPSSTYFGRGSTGGIINQVSKTPRLDPSYGGTFTGGTDFYLRGTVDVNQPLTMISPNAALRLNVLAHRNDVSERDFVENKRYGFAPSISFGLDTPTQFTLSYLTQYEDNVPDYGRSFFHGKIIPVDRETWYGLAKKDYEHTWANIGTAKLDHRFSDQLSVRNTLRYSHVDRQSQPTHPVTICTVVTDCTLPGSVLSPNINRTRNERDSQESILSNQTDLTAKFDTYSLKHTLTTGMEFSRETFDLKRWASAGPITTVVNPNPYQLPTPKTVLANSDTTAFAFGIYAADQLKLNQYFDIIGGVRWDYFDAKFDNKLGPNLNSTDRMFSYRGGLVFHPTQVQSYYFSYASSFNPSAEGLGLAANNAKTPPEKNETFEIGAKIDLMQGALSLTGALFRIDKTDARTNDPSGVIQVLDGKQRAQGVEFGVTGRVLPGLNVFAGYTFIDAEILKATDLVGAVPIEGNVPQNVPEHSATLWATYDFLEKWQIGGGPTYVGSRYANNQNTNEVEGYVRWDSTIAYQLTRDISLRFTAQNLTNKFFIESIHPSHVVPGAGRTFLSSATFQF
jgi:catecholate siderophore receptor